MEFLLAVGCLSVSVGVCHLVNRMVLGAIVKGSQPH
jgi:hypothetical protein